jgi:hypothetical protein
MKYFNRLINFIAPIVVIIFSVSFISLPFVANAGTCDITLTWLKDGKATSVPKQLGADDYQKYQLKVTIPGCDTHVRGLFDQGDKKGLELFKTEQSYSVGGFEKIISFGEPALTTYVYHIQKSDNEIFNSLSGRNFQEKTTSVEWVSGNTNSNGPIQPANNSSSNGSGSGGNSNTPNPGLPNSKIDTGVGVNFNTNYDADMGEFYNPLEAKSVPELIAKLIRILFILTGLAAVIVIIIAGFRMVIDNGNETQVKKAKDAITWAIVGLVVSILAFSIVSIIQKIIHS